MDFLLGWLFIWPMCYWFGLSPNDLPLAPNAATWSLTRIMALSRWIVECVSYVSGETLESLIQSLSLSLSSLARPKSLSLISLSSPMDLPLFLGNLSRYLQWVVVKATASVAECCEGLGFLCEVFLCELVFGASRSCVVELCGVDFCGKRLISSQIQRCSLGLVSGWIDLVISGFLSHLLIYSVSLLFLVFTGVCISLLVREDLVCYH